MDISSKIAQGLLSIGAVFLRPQEPFIWASGIKSPIYCDNRLILTAPANGHFIANLDYGIYFWREVQAPAGYAPDFYLCGHCTVHFLRKSAMTARLVPERSLA